MAEDIQQVSQVVSGGTTHEPADLNALLEALDNGLSILFAQGVFKLTANLTLPEGVTLVFDGDAELDGDGFELDLSEGRIILDASVEQFALQNITILGGVANSALITAERAITDPQAELEFNASAVTLNPASGASALSFERPATGTRDIAVTPAGSGTAVDDGFGIDLGSGLDTTILPKVYQQQQGEIALAKGLISVNSPESFKLATVTIDSPHPEDVLDFSNEAKTLAGLLRVSLDFDAEAGVLTIAPAEGRLLNAGLIELLLDSVKFNNPSSEPGLSRSFTYELTDRNDHTISATAILQINDLNAPPVLELNAIDPGWEEGQATATFVQAGPAVDITTNAAISLTDAEDDAIKFVTVQITDAVDSAAESLLLRDSVKPGDLFGLSPAALAALAGVTVAYDSASSTLTLQASQDLLADGIATTDLFEYLLNEVKYANTSANPAAGGNTTRTIEVLAKDTLNNNPTMSEALTFIIDIEADDLDAINAATDAAGMRAAIAGTPELEALLDDPKFDGLSEPRQNALLLDLVENRPETDGYTAFTQFSDNFFAPLADAYDAIRAAVETPSVASIQAALDALPAELTVSGEPGLDKAALQAQLDTFATLSVLKQPILDAVAGASAVDSLVGLVAAAVELAPDVVVAQVNAATTPAGIQGILTDVFVYASGGPVDGYGDLQVASQDFAALALLQGRGTEGYGDFATLEAAFTAAVALGASGEAFVTAANAADVGGLIAAANAGLDALDGISIDAFDKTALGSAIDAFETLVSARQAAVANDLQASSLDASWSLADLYGSNLLALTGALVEFRVATAAAVDQASDGVLTLQALQDVADALANIADKKADAQVNGTNIANLAQGAATELERLTDLSPNRLQAVLEDVSEGSFTSFAQLSAQLNTVLEPREDVQAAVEGLVDTANESVTTITTVTFTTTGGTVSRDDNSITIEGTGPSRTVTGFEFSLIDANGNVTIVSNLGTNVGSAQFDEDGTLIGFSVTASVSVIESIGDGSITGVGGENIFGFARESDVEDISQVESQQVDLSVADFQAVQTALQAIVTANLRETLTDGTLVEDISAADLDAAITLFGNLSQATRDATLAAVQAGDGYTTLGSVLDAFEPAIEGVLLDALNAAPDAAGVLDVLADAAILYPAEFTSFDALEGESKTFAASVLLANQPYPTFDDAEAAFGQSVALVQAAEAFLGAANAANVAGLSDALDAALTAIGDLTVPGALKADIEAAKTALDGLAPGRDQAAANDLKDNGGTGWTLSDLYTGNLLALGARLVEFRAVLEESINAAEGGNFARGAEGTLEGVLAKLEAIEDVKSDATINGFGIAGIITDKQALIDRVNALTNDPEPRFDAFVEDLKGSYSSFTNLVVRLDAVLTPREAVQAAVNAVIDAADGDPALTVELFEDVRDALQAIETEGLTTEVGGETVEDISADALAAKLLTFGGLRPATQEAVLAEVQTGSFTTLGGVLDAFPAALDKVALDLVNEAGTATELLDALADIAVYVTDNAALDAVLDLRDADSARAEALANDFLLNRDGDFTSLSEAGDLLAVLEDVYSGLDVNFDAGLFDLGEKGADFFTLDVGGDSVKLGNIGSIAFGDTTVQVAGAGEFQTVTDAIGAAGTDGDFVLVAKGDYDETINVNKEGLTIVGPNAGVSGHDGERGDEAKFTASGSNASFRVTAENVTIDGVQLALVPTGNTPQIDVGGNGASFLNNIINAAVYQKASGLTFEGNFVGDFGDALGQGYSGNAIVQDSNNVVRSDWVIRDNVFDGTDRGIVLASSGSVGTTYENLLIEGNVFQGIAGRGVQFGDNASVNGVTITGNTFKDGSAGIGVFTPVSPIDGLVIDQNTFSQLDFGVFINASAAADLFVDQTSNTFDSVAQAVRFQSPIPELDVAAVLGADTVEFGDVELNFLDGSYEISFGDAVVSVSGIGRLEFSDQNVLLVGDGLLPTIQGAVVEAEEGDTIIVLGDDNYGPVTLDKGVTLVAADGASPTITGAGVANRAAIEVANSVQDVSVSGFNIAAGSGDVAAVYLIDNNAGISLEDNTITGGDAHAVLTGGGMNNVTLTGNTISGDGPMAVVYVNGDTSRNNPSEAVSLIDNTITGGANAGLLVRLESTGGFVQGNSFEGSASYAALELFGADVTIGGTGEGEANSFAAFPRVIIDANGNYALTDLLANNDFVEPEIVLIRNADTGNIYNSLAEALGDAQSGQTVKVSAGELDLSQEGRLTVPEGVTLTGAGLDNGAPLTTLKGALLELADDATVEGLAFTDYDARVGGGQEVVLVSGDGATVRDSTFTVDGASSSYAFEIRVTGEDAIITGNTITRDADGDTSGSSIGNPGIRADGVGKINITGNTLERAIIGVVTAAEGVDLTITGNQVTPTVVSNDGIFVTGPGFGNIPDGADLDIGENLFQENGDGDLLGLQLRGTETEGFDFRDFATNGQDFFQGGTGDDTFALQGTGNLLDGGADGIDTVEVVALKPSDLTRGSEDGDVLLDGSTLRNIERLDDLILGVVSLEEAAGFTILVPGDVDRPDIRLADDKLFEAVVSVSGDEGVPNALTLEGGDYSGPAGSVFFGVFFLGGPPGGPVDPFTLTIDGASELPKVFAFGTLILTGSGNVSMVSFDGDLDASELSGSLTTTPQAGSSIIGGSNVDVMKIGVVRQDENLNDRLDLAEFDRAFLSERKVDDRDELVIDFSQILSATPDIFLSAVETLVFDDATVHVAGVGTGRSVQDAVDAAGPGDVVFIGNGTYDEVVTIPSGKAGLTIIGSDDVTVTAFDVMANGVSIDNVVIDGGGNTSGSTAGIYVAASGVELSNLTLTGPGEGAGGGQSRGILTESGKGDGLKVSNVTATDWATGIYLDPGATGAEVTGSNLSGNFVGMSIDGIDGVTLTGNTFGGTLEDLGLGAAGIASATGNTFVNGQFGNFTGQVVALGANTVAGTGFDSVKLGQTQFGDTITLVSESGTTLVVGGGGTNTVVAPDEEAFGRTLNSITENNGEITLAFEDGEGEPSVTAILDGVQRFQATIDTLENEFGSVGEDGVLTVSLVADAAFPVKLEGSGDRPDIYFDAADLPGVMALAAQQLEDEAVVITLMDDQAAYPGVIDLTDLDGGFNATSITVERDGEDAVFIGPVFAPAGKVVLGDGVSFANVAPQLADPGVTSVQGDPAQEGDVLEAFEVSRLKALFTDLDVGSEMAGIAVTGIEEGANLLSGSWQFKEPNRSDFQDLAGFLDGGLSESNALLLAGDTQLRFVPEPSTEGNPNFGNVPALSFVGVDSTQPAQVGDQQFTTPQFARTADVTERGGSTPYSAEIATFTKAVLEANDPGAFDADAFDLIAEGIAEDLFTQVDGSFAAPNENDEGTATVGEVFLVDTPPGEEFVGVAVVGNDSAPDQGRWEYSVDGGETWLAVGAVSDAGARFLDAGTELRFVPSWNFNGTAPALTARTVDATVGTVTSGQLIDASEVGRGTAFSFETATLGVEVAPVEDIYEFATVSGGFENSSVPGPVFTFGEGAMEAPVVSLLNFDRDSDLGERDLIKLVVGELGGDALDVILGVTSRGGLDEIVNADANVLIDTRGFAITDVNIGTVFEGALTGTGREGAVFDAKIDGKLPPGAENALVFIDTGNFFVSEGVSQGGGFGIFRDVDGVTSLWYAPELNPNAGVNNPEATPFDPVLLAYFAGSEWSSDVIENQDDSSFDPGKPTLSVEELRLFTESDFA